MVKIRLRRVGKKKQASFRVVVADARSPRDGRFIETIGHYNPRTDPPTVVIKEDRALYWLSNGAQPTKAIDRMLRNMGTYEKLKQVRQGVSIEELVAPPEPEVEGVVAPGEVVAEAEPEVEAGAVIAEAEAIVEAAAAEEAETIEEAIEAEAPAADETVAAVGEEVAEVEEAEGVEAAEEVQTPGAIESLTASGVSVESLGLSTRVVHVLTDAGMHTVQDVLDMLAKGEAEFLSIPGIGGKALEEVQEQLAAQGFLKPENEEAA